MDLNRDFADLLRALSSANARFLVVGAHAVAYHTEPRYTKDLDLWVDPTAENVRRLWAALLEFGAPLKGLSPADFTKPNVVYQMGVEPNRIDILMGIDGVTFATAWRNRVRTRYGDVTVHVLSLSDLIRAKRAVGRPQDLLDIQRLSAAVAARKRRRPRKRRR